MTSVPSNERTSPRKHPVLARIARIPTPVIFVISIALAVVVLWYQGALRDVVGILGTADVPLVLLAAVVYIATLGLLCYRWHLLVRMAQDHSDLPRASEAFLTSVVINYAAPIGLAVPSRAALTKRALGLDAHATGTIALWEIGMDVLVLGAGTVLWFGLAEGSLAEIRGSIADSAGLYGFAFGAGVLALAAAGYWLWRSPRIRPRILGGARRIALAPRERPAIASLAFGTTVAYWVTQGIVLAVLMRALDVRVTFEFVLGLTSLPILVGMLSPIPGGAVVREALMYAVARLAEAPGDQVVAGAVLYRIALFAAIPILYVFTRAWISMRERRRPTNPVDHPDSAAPSHS